MEETPRHTYQILTKRPERMAEVLSRGDFPILSNVWLGTSVEDERVLDASTIFGLCPRRSGSSRSSR